MSDQSKKNQKPTPSPWLLTGIMNPEEIAKMLTETTGADPEEARQSVQLFLEVMDEKLRNGYTIKLPYGTFYPVFGKRDPITGDGEMTVEFVPAPEVLEAREELCMERLNNPVMN